MTLINPLLGGNLSSEFGTTLIENSVWLDGSADYMDKTFSSGSAQSRIVYACWLQRNDFTRLQSIFTAHLGGRADRFGFQADDTIDIHLEGNVPLGSTIIYSTSNVFRDIGYYHFILSIDLNVDQANAVQLFVNGVENSVTVTYGPSAGALSTMSSFGNAATHAIGKRSSASDRFSNTYQTQCTLLVGQSIQNGDVAVSDILDAFEFGTSGSQFGPQSNADLTALAADAGGNSFALDFSDSANLGHDSRPHNLIMYSEALGSWTDSHTTVVNNALVAPDGSKTMDTVEVVAGSTYLWANRSQQNFTVELSKLYTVSVYMKHSGSNRTLINYINPASPYTSLATLYHNWSGGTPTQHAFSGTGATGTPVLEDVGDDIWRISFQVMSSATSTNASLAIYPNAGFTGNDPVGMWGMQVEQGTLGTYVPTPKNLLLRTEEFDNASWFKVGSPTVTANNTVAPDGTTTADLVTRTTTGSTYWGQTGLAKAAVEDTYTLSCYAKKSVGNYFVLQLQGAYPARANAIFNLDTGAIHSTTAFTGFSNNSAQIISVGDGWYRCVLTCTTDTATQVTSYMDCNSTGSGLGSGDSVSNSAVFVWGAQRETGSTATSYRPTSNTWAINVVPNNFTPNSITAANQSTSTPSLVYPTLNTLDKNSAATLSSGNLRYSSSSSVYHGVRSTFWIDDTTPKIYWEATYVSGGGSSTDPIGLADYEYLLGQLPVVNGTAVFYTHTKGSTASFSNETAQPHNNVSYDADTGDVLRFAYDPATKKLWVGNATNGTYLGGGDPATDSTPTATLTIKHPCSPAVGRYGTLGTTTYDFNFGQTAFTGTVPTGFVSLNSENLTAPDLQGVDNFSVTLGTETAIAPTENLAQYSENPTSLFNTYNTNTITLNYAPAPNGTMTAALVADTSTSVGTFMMRNISIPDDSSHYTWSFYVKKDQNVARFPAFWLNFHGNSLIYNYMNLNTKTGEIHNFVAVRLVARSVSAGDYWRVSMTVQNDSSGNNGITIRIDPAKVSNFTASPFAGDVTMTGSIVLWGNQLELGSTASTYIPTYTNTAASLPYSEKLNLIDTTTTENYIRNNTMEGVVPGTPGTAPTGWVVIDNGTTVQLVGSGVTADGIEYVDIKFSGTPTSGDPWMYFQDGASIPALAGETWTYSAYVALIAGSLTNLTSTAEVQLQVIGRNSAGSYVSFAGQNQLTPTSALVKHAFTGTLAGATLTRVSNKIIINWDGSGAIDATFRIGNPQMEKRSHASQVIKTGQYTMNHNLALQSQTMDNATWVKSSCAVSTNVAVAPDGTTTAEGIQALNSSSSEKRVQQGIASVPAGTFVTASFYVKAARLSFVAVAIYDSVSRVVRKFVNLSNGAIGSDSSGNSPEDPTFAVESVGDGWYRISAGERTVGSGTVTMRVQPAVSDGNLAYSASESNVDEIYVWGAQFEKTFNSPRTYLPTTTEAVYEPTKRTSLPSYLEIQKNRDAAETWAWRFNDYDKEYAVSNTNTYQDIRAQTGTNNWVSYALKIAASSGTAAGAVSHGFATGNTVVTHGLTSSRYAVLLFPRNGGDIYVYHPDAATGELLILNSSAAAAASTRIRDVTTTTFSINSGATQGVYDYLVLDDNGSSAALGNYIGNSSDDGPYLSLGFKPAWWMVKETTVSDASHDWFVADSARYTFNGTTTAGGLNGGTLEANDSTAEEAHNTNFTDNPAFDFLADGIKLRSNSGTINATGRTYIYLAMADIGGNGTLPPVYGR